MDSGQPVIIQNLSSGIQSRLGMSSNDVSTFCQRWGICTMALFGSILRDDFTEESDIDILVSFAPDVRQGLLTIAKIKHELETQFVQTTIKLLHKLNYTDPNDWSRPLPTGRPNEVMAILTKKVKIS